MVHRLERNIARNGRAGWRQVGRQERQTDARIDAQKHGSAEWATRKGGRGEIWTCSEARSGGWVEERQVGMPQGRSAGGVEGCKGEKAKGHKSTRAALRQGVRVTGGRAEGRNRQQDERRRDCEPKDRQEGNAERHVSEWRAF